MLEEIKRQITLGSFDYVKFFPGSRRAKLFAKHEGEVTTIAQGLERFLKDAGNLYARSTYLDYRNSILNFLIPGFGSLKLTDLRQYHLRAWCADRSDISRKRQQNILLPLRAVFAQAREDEMIERNPLFGWSPPKKVVERDAPPVEEDPNIDPFAPEEMRAILAHCEGQERNLYQFNVATGLRTGEIIALEWGDIDWINRKAKIRRNYTRGQTKGPKTSAGYRDVDLNDLALGALQAQKAHSFLAGKYIFHNPETHDHWRDTKIRKAFAKTLRRAKVRYRYPYQLRHTYASTMLSAGEDPAYIARQMGHKDWGTIRRVYARWIPSIRPEAGNQGAEVMRKFI